MLPRWLQDLVFGHRDVAARQLVELLITAYLSMAAYVLFKVCEHRLVRWLAEPGSEPK